MPSAANPIYDRPIDHPAAWTSAEIGGKEGLVRRMAPEHVRAVRELVDRTRHIPTTRVTRQDFDHPLVDELMAAVRFEIMRGKGAVVLQGLDPASMPAEDYERAYWGLGTHLGRAAIQSPKRDLIGYVQKVEDNPERRGYQLDVELRSHTDFHEVLSLACVRRSASGGRSGAVSALAIHNLLLKEAPDALKTLYEGFWHGYVDKEHLTAEKAPVFCNVGGVVSCYYHALSFLAAARTLGLDGLPEDLRQAMAAFGAIAQRPEVRADFMLEPGEMLFWHNFVVLHSREAFTDTPEQKRLLLRLWLHVPNGRPMHREFIDRARLMDELHEKGVTALQYRPYMTPEARTPAGRLAAVAGD
jgi:hypothetical protein